MTLESPVSLVLLIIIPILIYLRFKTSYFSEGKMSVPTLSLIKKGINPYNKILIHIPFVLTLISLILIIISLARPQFQQQRIVENVKGIEIILAVDTSLSMWFVDDEIDMMRPISPEMYYDSLKPIYYDPSKKLKKRILIAKKVIVDFIDKRPTDKIGLITFKASAITLTSPTMQHNYVKRLVQSLNLYMVKDDGTAIGDALGTSINALKFSQSENKIIILITDGNDNQENRILYEKYSLPEGNYQPHIIIKQMEAAKLAANKNIKIYTIGMGGKGRVFRPYINGSQRFSFQGPDSTHLLYKNYESNKYFEEYEGENINEIPLRRISQMTGGKFYRANNEKQLQSIYSDIDKLEKTHFDDRYLFEKDDIFTYFLIPGIIIFSLGFMLKYTILRVLP